MVEHVCAGGTRGASLRKRYAGAHPHNGPIREIYRPRIVLNCAREGNAGGCKCRNALPKVDSRRLAFSQREQLVVADHDRIT